jgi:rhodanese-related sulfurtransferase
LLCGVLPSIASLSAEHTTESLADVKLQVEQGRAVLVDVREPSEWNAGHIQGAIALPLSTVSDGLSAAELAKLPRDKVLYTYCVVGKRALTVGTALEQQGLKVKVLKPGYKELIAAGFPVAGD